MGTLNLYADRPVKVGDFCRYGEDPSSGWLRIGTIEEIGLRSTRIRGIDRTVTTFPNAEFSNMEIINLTKRDRMVFRPTLALRYETTGDQLRFVLAQLREMLLAHPRVTDDPARVRFAGFADYAMKVDIFAYVNTADWNEFLAIQEDIYLRILRIIEQAGSGFAFPSRTLYHTRDGGLDAERQEAAEKQVREWAAAHVLPFPEFAADYRDRIMDTLDYPPEGSPGADRA
jgi:MscS family membrane protein